MIKLSLSVDQTLMIETPGVTLRGAQPVLNGRAVEWAELSSWIISVFFNTHCPSGHYVSETIFCIRSQVFNSLHGLQN